MSGGKRAEAAELATWLADAGEYGYGKPTHDYLLFRAADRLNMSVPDLDAHPDKNYWIYRALTTIMGENDGEKQRAAILKSRRGMG